MTTAKMAHELTALERETFSIRPTLEDDELVAQIAGNGDMAAIEPLAGYLKVLHKEALRLGVKSVRVDVRELYFLNSSCLKSILSWVSELAQGDTPAYGVCFVTNAKLFWQRRSLEALRRLAPQVVTLS
jgi:hypothetical protein